jgi:hypothetical protein
MFWSVAIMGKQQDGVGKNEPISTEDLEKLLELLTTIRYGSVTLIVQDGKVVQIDRNEKMRLK